MSDLFIASVATLSFLMSFSIGANDAANALATSYGSHAAKLVYLLVLGAFFEFLGAYFCSGRVAGTLVQKIIIGVDDLPTLIQEQMMLGASLASFVFIMSSSLFGMPISGTHTVVGALIGAGIVGAGASDIGWSNLGRIVISWFISPLLTAIISYFLFMIVCYFTLGSRGIRVQEDFERHNQRSSKMSLNAKLLSLTLIGGFSATLITFMTGFLVADQINPFNSIGTYSLLPLAFFAGLFICRIILLTSVLHTVKTLDKNTDMRVPYSQAFCFIFKFWTAEFVQDILLKIKSNKSSPEEISINQDQYTEAGTQPDEENNLASNERQEHLLIAEVYRYMMVAAALMVNLSHGANDVANSISPLLIVFKLHNIKDNYAYLIGSVGIALGLLLLGRIVMETVGKKVIKLDFPKGFSAQLATAISVILGTVLGLPLSTTHCMVGALFGIIYANHNQMVQSVYAHGNFTIITDQTAIQNQAIDGEQKDENSAFNKAIICKIVMWWLATVPVALAFAMFCTWGAIKTTQ